jgi:ferredoxin/flavodoxin---NADP+ reductase
MIFDAFIIGGGVSGMQCALLLGSATNKSFALNNVNRQQKVD